MAETIGFIGLGGMGTAHLNFFRKYVGAGGGVVALHETAIMRPSSEGAKLARCLGMAR